MSTDTLVFFLQPDLMLIQYLKIILYALVLKSNFALVMTLLT